MNAFQPLPLTTDQLDNYFNQALTPTEQAHVVNTNLDISMVGTELFSEH